MAEQSTKKINARIVQKHAHPDDWVKAENFVPKQGEIIVYDDRKLESYIDDSGKEKFQTIQGTETGEPVRFKIGDGVQTVDALPFAAANDLPIEKGAGTGSVQQEGCTASGNNSFAVGQGANASNNWAYAEGFNSQATGAVAHAEGQNTEATAIRAHAEGYQSKATGDTSHAEGWITSASGTYSHTEGENTEATGQSSHAEGRDTHARGGCCHTEGDQTYAVSNHCHAEGFGSIAGKASGLTIGGSNDLTVGIYSHAEGNGTYAEGNSSHAEGCKTKALGRGSHAEGWETVATETGTFSHVEGHSSQAQGNVTHAEGWGTIASGTAAHSEGRSTSAEGEFSHAGGLGTKATAQAQTAIGKYNAEEATALFIVGNGTADDARSNLFSVGTDTDGNYAKIGNEKVATKSTTLLGYGIEDAYTKDEVDIALDDALGRFEFTDDGSSTIAIKGNAYVVSSSTYDQKVNICKLEAPLGGATLTIGDATTPSTGTSTEEINEYNVDIEGTGFNVNIGYNSSATGWTIAPVINVYSEQLEDYSEINTNISGNLYYNGSEVAIKNDIPDVSNYATKDDIFDIVRANSDAIVGHGISYIVASGTANAVSPAYTETVLASGITLKKGKGYRFNVSVDRGTTTAKTVWVSLKDSGNNQLKQLTLSTSVDNSSLDFNLTTDYSDAYISFKTEVTSGYTVSANLELTAESGSERYSPNTEFIADDFVNGDATFWNGGATINYGATYRVTCTLGTMYKYAQDVHIKAADGFKFVIGYYNDGACTSESGWQSEITVPANQQFRIMIQRATPNTSEVADVAEFVSKLRIYTNGLKEIYDLVNENNTQEETTSIAENSCVKPFEVLSINHRGYNRVAPENTLAAYRLSKKNGFDFVECDVRFTSDGVPVLLHDESINRTARNADGSEISSTINIADITYETALTYDFGIWKGEEYAGTKIPTLAEFMQLCRALSIYPYLDLYVASSATHAQAICDVIKSCGMEHNVTFMSPFPAVWNSMSSVMPEARYGLISWEADPTTGTNIADYIDTLRAKGVKNIFAMGDRNIMDTSLFIAMCKEKGVSLETYSPNTEEEILALDPFISGIISDTLVAKDVLRYTNDEAQIKVGSTTITETQLQSLLSLLNNIYDGSVSFLITFKIDDVEYQAKEGMTWGEWCERKDLNTDGYDISAALSNQVVAPGLIPVFEDADYSTVVYDVNPIIENHRYYT